MKHGPLLAGASAAALALAASAYADQSAPPSYGIAAGWPGGAGQVTVKQIASRTLNTLSLSPLTATAGSTYTGTLSGDTAGSALALSNTDGGACSLNLRTVTCTGLTAGTANIAVTETLAGATNSPKTTPFSIVVSAPASYAPTAVTFSTALSGLTTNNAAMTTAAGTVSDTSHFTIFAQFRLTQGKHNIIGNNTTSYATDFISSQQNSADGTENMPGIIPLIYDQNGWRFNIGDSMAASFPDQSHNCNMSTINNFAALADQNWHYMLLSGDLTGSGTTKSVAAVVDGLLVNSNCTYAPGGPMLAGISERGFAIRDFVLNSLSTGAGIVQFGEVWADYSASASIVCNNTANITVNGASYACPGGQGSIPAAVIAKFWKGGPVDLGPNGSGPLGYQPHIFLGRQATPSTWQTNLGTVNNLAATGLLYNSPSAPSTPAPAHKAYVAWSVSSAGTGADTSEASDTGGNQFAANDLALYIIDGTVSGGGVNNGLASACPTSQGFTMLLHYGSDTNTSSETVVCSKIATGSEPEALPSGTFTAFQRGVRWAILDIKNASSIRASAVQGAGGSDGSSSLTSGTVSGVAGDTLLTIAASYLGIVNGANPLSKVAPNSGDVVLSSDLAGSNPQITVAQETLVATGATTARTFTVTNRQTGEAQPDWANMVTLDIQPN